MINIHSPVKTGSIVKQDDQYQINGIVVRGNTQIALNAINTQGGEEIPSGLEMDVPSFVNLCKLVLTETGTLPKWFYFGVIIDSTRSQLLTYFSPQKEKFFSDIYNYIKDNLAGNLPMSSTEAVVKNFFENNRDYHFNYQMIPLEALLAGSGSGRVEPVEIRI